MDEEQPMTVEQARKPETLEEPEPWLRVFLLGTFRLEWLVASSGQEDAWKHRTSARALFLLLVCAPGRQASRSQLAGILWPETEEARALESLRVALKVLRQVIRTAQGEVLVEVAPHSDLLRLADQSRLWIDVEAFEALVQQASQTKEIQQALQLWEGARTLLKGEFLEGEQDREWSFCRWIKLRRKGFSAARRRMIYHLAKAYLQTEQQAQAEEALIRHVTRFPTDQDALYLLVKLLIEEQRFEEAHRHYEDGKQALAAQGKRPARYLQVLDEHVSTLNVTTMVQTPLMIPTYSDTMAETMQLQNRAYADRDSMRTRRQILHHFLMIGSTALVLSPYAVLYPEESGPLSLSALEDLETITASYWRLCTNTSLDLLGNLSEHFHTVVNLLQQALPHKTALRLCSLAGESAQILGKTLFDLQEYTLSWSYYLFSIKAAQTASNHDLWATGIGRIILLLIYWEHPQNALPLLQEVHQLSIQDSNIVCWLRAVEAEVYAYLGDAQACEAALKTAKEISKSFSSGEDRYATGFSASRLAGYEGACFVRLHQPDRALLALQQALALLDPQAIRRRSTLFTDMGIAYAQQGNIQKACQLAAQALSITKQTRSKAVLERVRTIRFELEEWREMNEVKDLEKHIDTTSTLIMA